MRKPRRKRRAIIKNEGLPAAGSSELLLERVTLVPPLERALLRAGEGEVLGLGDVFHFFLLWKKKRKEVEVFFSFLETERDGCREIKKKKQRSKVSFLFENKKKKQSTKRRLLLETPGQSLLFSSYASREAEREKERKRTRRKRFFSFLVSFDRARESEERATPDDDDDGAQ